MDNQISNPQPPTRNSNTFKSDIFNTNTQSTCVKTNANYNKSSIFTQEPQPKPQTRENPNTKSNIFYENNPPQRQTQTKPNPNSQSTVFSHEIAHVEMKENPNKIKDHGKNYLFGKSDYDDYKVVKDKTKQQFVPNLVESTNFEKKQKDFHQGEIQEVLPVQPRTQRKAATYVPEKDKCKEAQEPNEKKAKEQQSDIFNQGKTQTHAFLKRKVEEKKTFQNEDPKVSRLIHNQSCIFETKNYDLAQSVVQAQPKAEDDLQIRKTNQNYSNLFGQELGKKNADQKHDKLIPNNQNWKNFDSIRNQQDVSQGESKIIESAAQRKMLQNQSEFDNHKATEAQLIEMENGEKISKKLLKNQKDIISTNKGFKDKKVEKKVKPQTAVKKSK